MKSNKEESDNTSLASGKAVGLSQKIVTIEIDMESLTTLKEGYYKLCFAKKIEEEGYTVVWYATLRYLSVNEFSWRPMYMLFGTDAFQDGRSVRPCTNSVSFLGKQVF